MINKQEPRSILCVGIDRVVMHVDLDYFFAQCEEVANPLLKAKPVVVCVYSGRSEDSGAVSTANYIARKYGVKSGMPIAFAKRILKDTNAAFLPVNHELYGVVSNRVMDILRSNADRFEQESIDEAFMDVSKRVNGDFKLAEALARSIKGEIMDNERLSCSIGVGPNKVVAKIASDFQKPDGLTVIRPEGVRVFLDPLPAEKLYGVGKKTAKKLQELGVFTIGDLAAYDPGILMQIFGDKPGSYFHRAAKGIDEEPVQEKGMAEQVSRMITLKRDTRDLSLIASELDRICSGIHARLVGEGLLYKSVGILAITNTLEMRSRTKTLENPSEDAETIERIARELLSKFLEEEGAVILRRFGVKVSGLSKKSGQGLTKFL